MLLFVLYAMLVWYGAFQGRRRLGGIAALVIGLMLIVVLNKVHFEIAKVFGYEQYVVVFRVLLYPYGAMVGCIGLFLVMLPIDLPRGELHCRVCRYDLTDLIQEVKSGQPCPECGATLDEASTRKGRRLARKRFQLRSHAEPAAAQGLNLGVARSASDKADDCSGDEHEDR